MDEALVATHLPLEALKELHRNWWLFLLLGLILIALGTIAISAAGLSTIVSVMLLGWLLVFGGASVAVHAFWAARWRGFFLQLLSGLFYLVVGWILVTRPGLGAEALTLLLAISLTVQGAFRVGAVLGTHVDGGGWLILSGVVTLVLGLMIWNQWPVSGLWVIGLFVGIDLVFYGWWIVSLALTVRRLPAT
jgi:uncharacterized membrane protein HdeD (DUF308 family)